MNDISELAKQLGKRGGDKTKQKYGTEYYRKISKKAAAARSLKVSCPTCGFTASPQTVLTHQKHAHLSTS